MSKNNSIFGRAVFLLLTMVLVSVILPRMDFFSHDIEIVDAEQSTDVSYLALGDESAAVTSLQVKLYSLDYLELDDISGRFDPETLNALNNALADNNTESEGACSYENYSLIMALDVSENAGSQSPEDENSDVEAETPPEVTPDDSTSTTESNPPETEATTASTTVDPNKKMRVCVTAKSTKLRDAPSKSGVPLYLLVNGDNYLGISEAVDENGVTWYRIKYSASQFGWVISTDVSVYYE